jgi:arginyl-tRNA--protein-N-Asp/Glu arginylyltransferase
MKNAVNPKSLIHSVIACYSIRSKTNEGEFCKQTFLVISSNDNKSDIALSVHKLVLTDRYELYEKYGFENLKQFKNQRLYKQIFSIKLKTLNDVLGWLNRL